MSGLSLYTNKTNICASSGVYVRATRPTSINIYIYILYTYHYRGNLLPNRTKELHEESAVAVAPRCDRIGKKTNTIYERCDKMPTKIILYNTVLKSRHFDSPPRHDIVVTP